MIILKAEVDVWQFSWGFFIVYSRWQLDILETKLLNRISAVYPQTIFIGTRSPQGKLLLAGNARQWGVRKYTKDRE